MQLLTELENRGVADVCIRGLRRTQKALPEAINIPWALTTIGPVDR